MHEHNVAADEAADVLVAVGEACNNAIEHGSASLHGSFELEADDDGDLTRAGPERGSWQDLRDDGGGRGLPVMKALMDDVEIERGTGTSRSGCAAGSDGPAGSRTAA